MTETIEPTREPLTRIWARRAITWPLYVLLFVVVWSGLPAWLLLAFTIDLITGRPQKRPLTRTVLLFAIYFACELVGVVAAGAVWLRTLASSPAERIAKNAAIQRAWTRVLFGGLRFAFGMSLVVEGADAAAPAPLLLFVRHSSTADTLLASAVVANPHGTVLRYVLKRELLWDPCLDLVGRRLPNAFVDRSGDDREAQLASVGALTRDLDARSGVLIYPEGTRFSEKKRARAIERLEADASAELVAIAKSFTHVLPPRLGGPVLLLERMRGTDVVFLDHYGFEGAASFGELVRGALVFGRIDVRLRRVRASEVPTEHVERWLFEAWRETDRWVAARAAEHEARRASERRG
ncbi:MAG: 1-acyl-sn-glycerol-3-phosphate acyltransferase [Polyangiaceae bacterium]